MASSRKGQREGLKPKSTERPASPEAHNNNTNIEGIAKVPTPLVNQLR